MPHTYLHLEDGEVIEGVGFGFDGSSEGEVVFSTGMTGYPQSLTDPSFAGQILTFTYPLIGNYGIPKPAYQDAHLLSNLESERVWVKGVIVSSCIDTPSHFQMHTSLSQWLLEHKVPGISHIDTRALTKKIREKGCMRGVITHEKTHTFGNPVAEHFVSQVSCKDVIIHKSTNPNGKRILVIDCGVKHGILRALLSEGYDLVRIPWNESPAGYLGSVDGVFCSNGPGDPKECQITIDHISSILDQKKPFIGVCLGHQLVALASGADTYKLPYGHRGLNQPCMDMLTNKAYVTSQNHGYAVKKESIQKDFSEWFVNLNDQTNEGLYSKKFNVFSTQFHPEGSPGPFDTKWIFSLFKK